MNAPDWSPRHHAPKHLDGRPCDWQRPVSDEPHSLVDSWPFLIPGCLIAVGILIARVAGVL